MLFSNPIVNMYKKHFFSRCDETHTAFYYTVKDFEGLIQEPYVFPSSKGHELQGYFYHYEIFEKNRLIIFDHGFGEGHRAYMKEIEKLCHEGYLVFTYDHTGCMASGGINTGGASQSLVDLNDCLNVLKQLPQLQNYTFSVMGHSWGGYACLNIASLHKDLSHIIVLSGFLSISDLLAQNFVGIIKAFRKDVFKLERESNPNFVDYNGIDTLKRTLSKVLLIYSEDDPIIQKSYHYDPLYKALSTYPNIHFLLTQNKKHNPNYTEDAVSYLNEFQEAKNNGPIDIMDYDWDRMTKQDEKVWEVIFKHLKQ